MSSQKQITSKKTIKSNSPTGKNIPPELQNVLKNEGFINPFKIQEKELLKPSQINSPQQNKQDSNSQLQMGASQKNFVENTSDLQSQHHSQFQKLSLRDKNNKNSHQNSQSNRLQRSIVSEFSQFDCQDIEIKGYFSQFVNHSSQTSQINAHQKNIFINIKKELSKGNLLIQETKPFPLRRKQKPTIDGIQMKQKLQQKKQQALMKIKQIEMQELQLKRRAISTFDKPRKHAEYAMNKISQSIDKQEVKKALQQYKKFNKKMQKKEQKMQKQKQHQHMLELQKQEEIMRIRKQSRRQVVKNNLKEIVQRQRIRKSIIQEWKAKDKQIKNKKYLYIEYKEKQKKEEEIKEMQDLQVLDRIRKNHEFDKDDIEKHRRKYEELLEERKEMAKSLSSSSVTNNSEIKRYEMSKFHELVVKEMEEQKKKELEKLMKVKEIQHKEKIQKYQQKIDNEIKPNLSYKKFVPLPRAMSLEVLPPEQHRQLGLKYLEKAKKLKMPQNQLKILHTKRQEQEKLKNSRQTKEYKDYLQEMKKDIKYDSTEKKLNDMLKKKRSYSNYEILKDAKYMSDYLVQKSKHSDQQKTMLAIKKKMDILNAIY